MGAVGFYIFYGISWIITLLPLRILYIFSDLIFPFAYYFPGYRKKVVEKNLRNSFPEKTEKERRVIAKRFYRHFCDLIVETLKIAHMSTGQLSKRMTFTNNELIDGIGDEGRDVVMVSGHYNNWEWLIDLPLYTKLRIITIYKPLQNKHFDRYMIKHRSRNGVILTPMSQVLREVINNRKNNIRSLITFGIDQTPPKVHIKYWTSFLNQETPVYLGAEKIAVKYDMAVVFFNVQKVRRGYYSVTAELLFEHSAGLPEHLITQTHVKRLEEIIREKPEYWLWTHRRWKYKREDVNG